jgi:CTP:molybdopterin cytidylyltransferase MocA
VEALALAGLAKPLVVVGERGEEVRAEAERLGAEAAVNPDPSKGQLSSVKTGLKAAGEAEAVFILPVDAALVSPPAILRAAARHFEEAEGASRSATIAYFPFPKGGAGELKGLDAPFGAKPAGRAGHPVVLGREAARGALEYLGEGGLRGFLASMAECHEDSALLLAGFAPEGRSGARLRFSPCDASVLCDIDDEDDLKRALEPARPFAEDPALGADAGAVMALAKLATPPRKLPHCAAVALRSLRLAEALEERLSGGDGGGSFQPIKELSFFGGLLHDVDHGPSRHDLLAARRLTGIGWGDLAAVVGAHTELPPQWARKAGFDGHAGSRHEGDAPIYEGRSEAVAEAAVLVHMADKYTKGESLVSLDERFGAFVAYGGEPEAIGHVRRRWNAARAIEERLRARLGAWPMEVLERPPRGWPGLSEICRSLGGAGGEVG